VQEVLDPAEATSAGANCFDQTPCAGIDARFGII